ncbi:MAG: phosphoenolpyruvate--protein phosphotransferase [Rhizobiales bacterium]|nr:phosphoenolpyruvate--protein phosphotransferase [Hyphomicrobiales bacterium]
MPRTVEIRGRSAAPGLAAGPVFTIGMPAGGATRDPAGLTGDDLSAAIAAAAAELAMLAERVEGEGADILSFQVALLEDSALTDPARERIAAGEDAVSAWRATLDGEIDGYRNSDNDYFRARAGDLADLRDRVLGHLLGVPAAAVPAGAVLVGEDITPSRFLAMDWTKGGGIALSAGSPTSHVAILARSRGVPMLIGLGPLDAAGHRTAIVDGEAARLILSPDAAAWAALEAGRAARDERAREESEVLHRPALTADGVPVGVFINVADPDELAGIDPATCDGIGLVRTEFFFHGRGGSPSEEEQLAAYRRIVAWAAGRPVTFRTLDAGGDKPIAGLTIEGESNPFLGTRGIRLSLARPDVFRLQLRALARVAAEGNVKVMLPMVTIPEEIDAAAALLDEALAELGREGVPARRPSLGIMVEVPAVAVEPELFARAAFFSIGSNDLTQYVTAAARDISAVAPLCDPAHPAVIGLIRRVARTGAEIGRDVSLCGDMGGDPAHIPALVRAGLRSVSVAPPFVGRTKLAIAAARTA